MATYDPTIKVQGVSLKGTDGVQQPAFRISASGDDVMIPYNNANYDLTSFFQNYMTFLSENNFIAYGNNKPKNGSRFPIWIDTSGK